jgi:tight adherence protein B
MMTFLIMASVGVGVAALVAGIASTLRFTQEDSRAEDRLSALTSRREKAVADSRPAKPLLVNAIGESKTLADEILARFGDFQLLLEQADVQMSGSKFLTLCVLCASVGAAVCLSSPVPFYVLPLFAAALGSLPLFWLLLRRKKRMQRFSKQLVEALELMSRSLRAGHSLGAGFGLIAQEMPNPISKEFGRAFEEQNFGVSLEEALESMTKRVPNLDLRFFATAVILQRQTGGDLAEIMDKIGRLIRERFKLAGQIQALTGEGRLSGIVLLALPVVLFFVMYYLNYEYSMVLFNDPLGRRLLGGAIVMQFVGALVIRKIITIKV